MTKISIMQGRLSPPLDGRYQAFPAHSWEQEFHLAEKLKLYSIEWIFEKPFEEVNPLSTIKGVQDLKFLISKTGVQVKSVCADYYMTELLIKNGCAIKENWEHLEWLICQAKNLGIAYIVLPFVDSSTLGTDECRDSLISSIKIFCKKIERFGIELHIESDMLPKNFLYVLQSINHPLVKMNYDIGNSASLGYNPDEEFKFLGRYLGSVHIKDRLINDFSVPLGTGNANFSKCFHWFDYLEFNRWFVLQAAREEKNKEFETVFNQMLFVENEISNLKSTACC